MRGVVVVVLIVGLVGLMALGPRWLDSREQSGEGRQEESAGLSACRPLAETCQWPQGSGTASVFLAGLGHDELQLEAHLPGASGQVIAVLTGESMYMGEYPLRLRPGEAPGHYRATFTPPFCTTGPEMEWQVNFQEEGQPLRMPLRIVFRASEAVRSPSAEGRPAAG